jgi:hypothetical protein
MPRQLSYKLRALRDTECSLSRSYVDAPGANGYTPIRSAYERTHKRFELPGTAHTGSAYFGSSDAMSIFG